MNSKSIFQTIVFCIISLYVIGGEKENRPSRFNNAKSFENDKLVLSQLSLDENIRPWTSSISIEKSNHTGFENPSTMTTPIVLNTYKPDPRYTYHPEYSAKIGDTESFINFFPNVDRPKQINLRMMGMLGENLKVEISTKSGMVIFSKIFALNSDLNLISIDLERALYGSGVYDIYIKTSTLWEGFSFQY